jgi:hypothetical protein
LRVMVTGSVRARLESLLMLVKPNDFPIGKN